MKKPPPPTTRPSFIVAIYARVSTEDQNCAMQLGELREYCARRGWTVLAEYVDTGWSGKSVSRPERDRLMRDARRHLFNSVLVWKLDRWGRNLLDLVEKVKLLQSWGVRWISYTENIDTDQSSPMATLQLQMMAAFAEFERALITERVNAGLRSYREAFKRGAIGKEKHSRSGKDLPAHRPPRLFARDRARLLRSQGWSWRKIAAELKVPQATVRRACKTAPKLTPPGVSKALSRTAKPALKTKG